MLLDGLKAVAVAKFAKKTETLWASDAFIEGVEEIYSSTPKNDKGIREALLSTIKDNVLELRTKE